MYRVATILLIAVFSLAVTSEGIGQQPDPNSPQVQTLRTFARLLERANIDVDEVSKSVLDADSFDTLKSQVLNIRSLVANCDSVDINLEDETHARLLFEVRGKTITVAFEMTPDEPVRVKNIRVSGADVPETGVASAPFSWERLEAQMDAAAAREDFHGAVLVSRDGEVVFQKGYGFANREQEIKNTVNTVFAIGSQPIDFTHVAILKLKDQGKLQLDDPITKYFHNVPADKQSIRIRHLMTGQSGFPDFHGLPSDSNQDHAWIDRDEAVKRMLNHKLLFEPGKGNEHSHSAWGMLAVIVEIVSGQSYQDFTREHLFQPAGMNDTGFFGDEVDPSRIAVGYGELKSSDPNSPPHWGRTSWLVMGSGGQVSTLGDIFRWEQAVKNGTLLSPESTELFLNQHKGLGLDGDMFGFEFIHSYNPDCLFLLISNAIDSRQKRRSFMALGRQLNRLVQGADGESGQTITRAVPSKYTLGIEMQVEDNGQLFVSRVLPGSGAEQAGLQAGDRIVSANGVQDLQDPLAVLGPLLQSNQPIPFVIERDGKQNNVRVTPQPRK